MLLAKVNVNFRKVFSDRRLKNGIVCLFFQLFAFSLSLSAQNPPVISSISPSSAAAGATITITGTDFNTDSAAGNIVFFGATKAIVVSATATQLSVTVPSGASHDYITVLNTTSGLSGYSRTMFVPNFNGAGASISFAAKRDFTTGSYPFRVAASDLDGDGKPEMIVVNQTSNTVSVYRNTSVTKNISFATKSDIATNNKPSGLAIGDINGDGKPDMVVSNYNSNNVSVYINTSSGGAITFSTKTDLGTGSAPYFVAVNDIDLDGKPDIVVGNANSNTISVLRNTSTNITTSFAAKVDFSSAAYPMALYVVDIDTDGKPDVALVDQNGNKFSIFRNTSSPGTVSFAARLEVNSTTSSPMIAGDIDQDGKVDIILSNIASSAFDVLQNISTPGTVNFSAGHGLTLTPGGITNYSVNDFNGDGKIDLAVASDGYNTLDVIPNNSSPGSFQYGTKVLLGTPGSSPQGLTNADIDGDGKPDLLIVNAGSGTVSVYRNTASSAAPVITSFAPLSALQGATLTVTGSNFEDITSVKLGGTNAASFNVLSSTMMTVVVGAGASGVLSITSAGGTTGLSGFTYLVTPSITSIAPTAAISGSTVTITGNNFTNVISISFGGVNAASFNVLSSTVIQAVVGSGASGSVVVQTLAGTASKTGFSFLIPPTITAISPSSAGTGATITITGTDFSNVSVVSFGGVNASSFEVLSSTFIRAVVDSGSSGPVTVQTTAGIATKSGFSYLRIPYITSINPVAGAMGTAITLTGYNFANITGVSFGGVNAASFTVLSSTTLVAIVGLGASGTISVTNAEGSGQKAGFTFLSADPPVINSFSPGAAAVGATVIITGQRFNPSLTGNIVFFGATKANVTAATTTELRAIVPAGASYSTITVLNTATGLMASSQKYFLPVFNGTGTVAVFTSAGQFGTGASPLRVVVGDLNNDGKPDMVVNNQSGNSVSIFKNTSVAGNISFSNKVDFATGLLPLSLAIADINGDGKPDIVTSNLNSYNLSVLINSSTGGDISFAPKVDVEMGGGVTPVEMAVRDINLDGKPDLVTVNNQYNNLSILLNKSSQVNVSFGNRLDFYSGSYPNAVIVDDLDYDGKPDIVTVNAVSSILSIFPSSSGPGGLSFLPRIDKNAITLPMVSADIDGDGKTDIVTNRANSAFEVFRNTSNPGSISLVSGNGQALDTGLYRSMTVGDFNGDRKIDIAFARDDNAEKAITIVQNKSVSGTIEYGDRTILKSSGSSKGIASADIDGDGKPDLLVVDGAANKVSIFRNIVDSSSTLSPVIASFAPLTAGTGDAITITGANLSSVTSVTIGGTSAASFSVLSSTKIIAVVGNGSSGDIAVASAGGTASLSGFTYTTQSIPAIESFEPTSAGTGNLITITGSNLSSVTSVTIGGTSAASFSVLSSTKIIAVVGNGSSGDIAVASAGGNASKPGFVYVQPLKITGDSTMCSGLSVVLKSSATTGNQWYRNDTLILNATAPSYTATKTGAYKVVMINGNVSSTSNTIDLKTKPQPVAAFVVNDSVQCQNDLRGFNFTNKSSIADNNATLTYRWSFGERPNTSDLKNPSNTYSNAGTYTVKLVAISNSGCQDSATHTVTVKPKPVLVVKQPAAICNTTGALTIDISSPLLYAGSDTGLSFSYWRDDSLTNKLTNTAISATGTYYVKAVNASGCFDIAPVRIALNALPVVASITGDNSVCVGATIQLSNTTAGGVWSSNDAQALAIDNTGKLTGKQPGSYTVSYTYTNAATGCSNTVAKAITVNTSPVAGKPSITGYVADTLVCFTNSLSFTSGGNYDKYLWSTGATTSTITVSNDAQVWLKAGSNQSNCYSEPSVIVTAKKNITSKPVVSRQNNNLISTGSLSYKWIFNNKPTGDTLSQIAIGQRGAYRVSTSADRFCWNVSDDYVVFFDQVIVRKTFDLVAYPNPTNGIFNLQLTFDRNVTALAKVVIADQSGITMWSGYKLIFNDKSIKIPVSVSLAKGTYTVKVDVNGEVVAQQLIIM